MAIEIGTVQGRIRLVDNFTSELSRAASDLEKHGKRMQRAGRQMSDVGGQLTRNLTLPMVAVGAAAVKMATDINEGMANVATLIPGNTERVAELRSEIQGLAVDVGKSTTDLSEGLYQTISAFGDTAETVKVLEVNARAATAGLSTTLEAIDLTSAVTKGYGDTSAAAVQKAADLALMTVRLGQTTFPELAASMGRVIPLAEAVGQSQEDMFAVFATATGVVGRASEVATQYRGVINALLKPTEDLSKLIAAQGFASGESMLRSLGFVDTLELIGNTAKSTGKPITDYIAQIEAVPLALALAGPQAGVFREKLQAMAGAAGATDAAFREQTEGINAAGFAWKQMRIEVEVALQKLGQQLLPIATTLLGALRPVVSALEGMASALAAMPKPVQVAVVGLASLVAAAGPALFIAGQMTVAYGTLIATFPKVAAAFALAGKGIATAAAAMTGPAGWIAAGATLLLLIKPIREAVFDLGGRALTTLREGVSAVIGKLREWWQESAEVRRVLGMVARQLVADLGTALRVVAGALQVAWEWTAKAARAMADAFVRGIEMLGILKALAVAWDAVADATKRAVGWLERASGLAGKEGLAKLLIVLNMINPAFAQATAGAAAYTARAVELQTQQARMVKVASEVVGETENIILTTEEMDRVLRKAAKSGGGVAALSEEAQKLADRWRLAIEQSEQLVAAIEQGGRPAFEGLQRNIEAANEVLAAGVDPASAFGRELVALGVAAAAAARKVEIAVKELENEELADKVKALRIEVQRLWDTIESRAVNLELPDWTAAFSGESDEFWKDLHDPAFWHEIEHNFELLFGNATEFHENYLRGLQESFANTFRTVFKEGRLSFKDFFETVADLGIDLFAAQLSKALTEALEGAEGAWRNLTRAMSSGAGQLAGWMTAAGIVAGAQNTDYAALGAALGAAIGAYAANAVSGGMGGWAGAALGASVGAWLGSLIKKGSPEFFGAIESELGKIEIGVSSLGGGAKVIAKAFQDDLQEAMTRILEQIGGTLEGIGGGISLKMKDDKLSVFIDGLEHRFKEDIEGGISFALTEALKRADIAGASATFVQILQRTTAKSLEQLTDALDWGRWYERLRLGDVAADLQERMFKFGQDIRRAIEFGLPTDIITLDLGVDFQAYRNQILGIVESEEERIRRQAEAFNQWRQITEAEQLARKADLIIRKADLDAEIAIIRARMALDEQDLKFQKEMLDAEYQLASAEWELLHAKLQALAAVEQALAVVEGILASLPDLISGTEVDDAVKRARRGGPKVDQVAQDMERLADLLEQSARLGLSEYEQAVAAINDRWDDAIPLAHDNAQALADIAAARERELAALREQALLEFSGDVWDFFGSGGSGSPFVDQVNALAKQFTDLAKRLGEVAEELGLTGFEMLHFFTLLEAGRKKMEKQLATEGFLGLARGLADLTQNEELRHRLLTQVAEVEFTLRMAQFEMEFEMLKHLGYLTAEQIALIDATLADVARNRAAIIAGMVPPVSGAGGGGGSDAADERARALARLRDIQARAFDPFTQAIKGVVDEFAELRSVLGWTAEVQAVYAQEIQRVLMEQLEPIRRLQEELAFRGDSPMRSIDQFRLAQQNLNDAVAALRAGDLSQLEQIPDLARMVLDLNPSSQASEATRFLFARIQAILDEAAAAAESAVSGIEPGGANDPFAWMRVELTAGENAIVRAIQDVGEILSVGFAEVGTSVDVGTGNVAAKLPTDWSVVGVRSGGADDPPAETGPRRIAAESREIESLQRLREIAASNQSIYDAVRAGGVGLRAVGVG